LRKENFHNSFIWDPQAWDKTLRLFRVYTRLYEKLFREIRLYEDRFNNWANYAERDNIPKPAELPLSWESFLVDEEKISIVLNSLQEHDEDHVARISRCSEALRSAEVSLREAQYRRAKDDASLEKRVRGYLRTGKR
jgi:hypothetical protein